MKAFLSLKVVQNCEKIKGILMCLRPYLQVSPEINIFSSHI